MYVLTDPLQTCDPEPSAPYPKPQALNPTPRPPADHNHIPARALNPIGPNPQNPSPNRRYTTPFQEPV